MCFCYNLIAVETCKVICKRIKKHANEVFTSVESLCCVETVFKKADEVYNLYSLISSWLTESMNNNSIDQPQT